MVNYIIELSIDERMNMVYELLELLKANKLNDIQKKQIYEIVNKLPDRTEKQKERFFRFYNLLDGEKKDYRLCDMARYYNCTPGNIRCSMGRIRNKLINSSQENIVIMKNILEEYHNKN